jgi:phospholipid/cholesterol/gamma-HCH transport system substrate-binding protein
VKKKTYILFGILFTVALFIFIWGINYLKGIDIFSSDQIFYVEYNNVNGLKVSNAVTINGYPVGQVRDIILKHDYSGVVVKFSVDGDYKIPDSSLAQIYSQDLMGTKAIKIIYSNSNKYMQSGDTLMGVVEKGLKEQVNAEIMPLKRKAEDLIASFDSAATIVQNIFNEKTRRNLKVSFESLKNTIVSLERTTFTFDTLLSGQKSKIVVFMDNLLSISQNIKDNNDKINAIISNLNQVSDSLAKVNFVKTIEETNKTLADVNTVMEKIKNGEGTMGQLVNNDTLYDHLQKSARDLDILMKDIKENPKRYLHFSIFDFGKTVVVKVGKQKNKKK